MTRLLFLGNSIDLVNNALMKCQNKTTLNFKGQKCTLILLFFSSKIILYLLALDLWPTIYTVQVGTKIKYPFEGFFLSSF